MNERHSASGGSGASPDPPSRGPTGDEPGDGLRQRAVDALCEAFADDQLTVEVFERRVQRAHEARSAAELRELLADLPHRDLPDTVPAPEHPRVRRDAPGLDDGRAVATAQPHQVRDASFIGGLMGGGSRRGRWIPARTNYCLAVMGGVELDFREATFPPGVTEVRVLAFWGGVEIVVPPGVRVEVDALGLMGGVDHRETVEPSAREGIPVLRITGLAVMAGIEINVRYRGESGREARRRLRAARRARRSLPGWREE